MANEVALKTENEVAVWVNDVTKKLAYYTGNEDKSFYRSVMVAISENPGLLECLKTPGGKASLYNSLKYAAFTGLSLNPQEGKCALIGFKGKVQYQIMKNGVLEMAMNSGKVAFIASDAVRENDDFEISQTMNGDEYKLVPARTDRGKIDGFFAAYRLKTGFTHVKYMTVQEVEEHRDRYSAMYRANKEKSPWHKSFEGMALKTVLKAVFRNTYISDEMDKAIGTDDGMESGDIINVTPTAGTSGEDLSQKIQETGKPAKEKPTDPTKPEKDMF